MKLWELPNAVVLPRKKLQIENVLFAGNLKSVWASELELIVCMGKNYCTKLNEAKLKKKSISACVDFDHIYFHESNVLIYF